MISTTPGSRPAVHIPWKGISPVVGILATIGILALLIIGCMGSMSALGAVRGAASTIGGPSTHGYLWTSDTEVDYLTYTDSGTSQVSGSLHVGQLSSGRVTTSVYAFSGVHDGGTLTLTFSNAFGSVTWHAKLQGDTLVLSYTDTNGYLAQERLRAASDDDFNKALAALYDSTNQIDTPSGP